MGDAVAVEGETSATASSGTKPVGPSYATWEGAWTAGPVSETSYPKLKVAGKKVIHQAECTFSFAGTDSSSGVPVSITSDVTLTAQPTVLQKGSSNVLHDSDSASDVHGNKLEVAAAGHLSTT